MTTERTGGVKIFEGRVYARCRVGKNGRLEERLPWATPSDETAALERAHVIAELVGMLVDAGHRDRVKHMAKEAAAATTPKMLETVRKAVLAITKVDPAPTTQLTTFEDVAEDWTTGKLRKKHPDHVRKKASFKIERGRLKRYIYPHVKDVPISAFTLEHADLVMSKLPANRVKKATTRRHVAQIILTVLNYSVMPLKLIKLNPLPRGWLPRLESRKHYTCLFPREETKLLGCKEIDEDFRLFVGILDREGMRVSELADCEWTQWNLDEGGFTATKTKTNDPRFWACRPDTIRAMRIWNERHGKTKARPFIDVIPEKHSKLYLATRLRDGLKAAGVERAELFESTEFTGAMRAHDLRATFVTVSLAEGKPDVWIRDRTGHKTLTMIDRYRRTARQFEELKLGSLTNLVDAMGWGISRVILATGTDDEASSSDEDDSGSGAGIRTPIRGSKTLGQRSETSRAVANPQAFDTGDDEPPPGITQGSPTIERMREGLVLERARWDGLDAFALEAAR